MAESKSFSLIHLNKENNPFSPASKPPTKSRTFDETFLQEYEATTQIEELREKETTTEDCLRVHRINEDLRAKMVDWMIEVLDIFNCSKRTVFLSIKLMDLFFKYEQATIGVEELHVIGVTCMMIASKYEDIKALDMNTVYYQIAHEKLPKQYIVLIEKKILKVLDYKLFVPTVLDFLESELEGFSKWDKDKAYLVSELAMLDGRFAWIRPSELAQAVREVITRESCGRVGEELKGFLSGYDLCYQSSFNKYKMRPEF